MGAIESVPPTRDRQWQAMLGLVAGILGALSLPGVLATAIVVGLTTPFALVTLVSSLTFNAAALVVAARGRTSRLFGVAIAGMIISLLSVAIIGPFAAYTAIAEGYSVFAAVGTYLIGAPASPQGAQLVVVNTKLSSACDPSNCALIVTLKNVGTGSGSATVFVEFADEPIPSLEILDPRMLASGNCESPVIGVRASVDVDCYAGTDALRARITSGGPIYAAARVAANH